MTRLSHRSFFSCKDNTLNMRIENINRPIVQALDRRRGERQQQLLGVLAVEFLHPSISLHDVERGKNSLLFVVQREGVPRDHCRYRKIYVLGSLTSFPVATVISGDPP